MCISIAICRVLGHVFCAEGLKTSDSKVKAVTNACIPTKVRELKSFFGLVNYYGKFLLI